MIDLDARSLKTVREIVRKYAPNAEIRVFGSRVRNSAQQFADLDLALVEENPIDKKTMERLKDAFAESDLLIQVDVVDWRSITKNFQEIVSAHYEAL